MARSRKEKRRPDEGVDPNNCVRRDEGEHSQLANYLRSLLDSTDEGIYGIDLEAQCTLINRAGAEMVGFKPEELVGQNIHRLIHHSRPDGSPYPADECPIVRAISNGKGVRDDRDVFWRRDGSFFPVEYSSYPVIENGVVTGAVVTFVDITRRKRMEEALRKARDELERRVQERTAELAQVNEQLRTEIGERQRAEETLRQSEERFRKVFEEGPLGMALVGLDHRFLIVNATLCRMLGYSEQELTARTIFDVTFPEDVARSRQLVKQLSQGEILYLQTEKRCVRKTGEVIWANTTASNLHDAGGRVLCTLAMIQDITERKRAEQEGERLLERLREVNQEIVVASSRSQEQAEEARRRARELETIIESIADGVFLCDREGRIVDVNRAALRLIGLTRKEEALRPLVEYLSLLHLRHPNGRSIAIEELALSRALRGEVVVGFEEIARSLQTQLDISLLVSSAPIHDREGNISGAVEVMSDITRMRELDKRKDELIFVAAHELKTPVAIMKGYAQALLRGETGVPAPRRKMLDSID
ncbi:MAG: PAS domain S-box protein, partial [Chloroflexi bacterium]|nr:PAS domain S-box protein [Chloroflexota bacterium]